LKAHLPNCRTRRRRFVAEGLSVYDADVLVAERATADFFEAVVRKPDGTRATPRRGELGDQ